MSPVTPPDTSAQLPSPSHLFDLPAEYRKRIGAVAAGLAACDEPAVLLVTPGTDLQYLTGYAAPPLERLTCLIVSGAGQAVLVVPELEVGAAEASPVAVIGLEILAWPEGGSPIDIVRECVRDATRVVVDDHMWAYRVLDLQRSLPHARIVAAGGLIGELRLRKTAYEIEQLRAAGRAVDSVLARMGEWLLPGRTERQVAADVHEAMLGAGHDRIDFIIVASGPNSASPHHGVSDRQLAVGDAVVIDIGGSIASGYCSDSTRTFHLGNPPGEYRIAYEQLRAAQHAGVAAARTGVTCQDVDATCRDILAAADLAEAFVHRTGHGIGLATHEDPYIVAGNERLLEPGFAFSIEPGFYLPGRYGARIEDIVVCTDVDPVVCNSRPHELMIIDV